MQFRVPQNIAMEDHIIGPLTFIQFGILVLGGGISFGVLSSTIIPSPINGILGFTMGLFTVVLAVGKFNDQPMYRFIKYIFMFIVRPKVRVWHKAGGSEVILIKSSPQKATRQTGRTEKYVSHEDILRLATVLDSRGNNGVLPKVRLTQEEQKAKAKKS